MPFYPKTHIRTIKYDSPSGEIKISKYILPFQQVSEGYGFMGMLAEDVDTGQLQCHLCGKWFEQLPTHLSKKHDVSGNEYREQFGLLLGTALKSMRIRKIHSQVMQDLRAKYKRCRMKFKRHNKESGNRDGWTKPVETQNKYGVCELQVADKIMKLAKKLGKTPSLTEVIDEYGGGLVSLIHNRYASYITYVRRLGMEPLVSNHNPKYNKKYFIEKGIEAALNNKPIKVKKIFPINEQRYVYKFFRSWKELEKKITLALVN